MCLVQPSVAGWAMRPYRHARLGGCSSSASPKRLSFSFGEDRSVRACDANRSVSVTDSVAEEKTSSGSAKDGAYTYFKQMHEFRIDFSEEVKTNQRPTECSWHGDNFMITDYNLCLICTASLSLPSTLVPNLS